MTMMTMMTWLGDILPSNALTPAGDGPVSLSQCWHSRQAKAPDSAAGGESGSAHGMWPDVACYSPSLSAIPNFSRAPTTPVFADIRYQSAQVGISVGITIIPHAAW